MRRWRLVGAGLLAFLGACAAWDRRMVPMPNLEEGPLRSTQFADVPVPAGLILLLDRGQSASFEAGDFRWADLRYEGGTPLGTAAAFIRHQLPGFGWRITDDASPRTGELSIRAVKQADVLRYRLRQGDRSLRMRILLNVPEEAGDPTRTDP